MFVFASQHHFEEYEQTNRLLTEEFGVTAIPLAGDKLVQFEPALKAGLGGGWLYGGDCHLRPDKLMSALRAKLEQRGAEIVEQFEIDRFVGESNHCRSVSSADGREIEADAFVVATGAWSPFLNRHLGCRLPIQPGKGYSLTMPQPSIMPQVPMVLEEHRVAITPMRSNYRIGSTMEFAGYDTSINRGRLEMLKRSAGFYLRDPYTQPIEEEWFGWRPMTWDGKPIIDRSPAFQNVWIAAGHNMLGISMATGTGKLIAESLRGETPHIDISHYTLSRFQR